MFDFTLNLTDPSKNSFYFPIIMGIATVLLIIQLSIMLLKHLQRDPNQDINASMDKTLQNNFEYQI